MDVHHRIRDLFDSAIDLPKDRRADYLQEQCGDNHGLYEEVARLVEAYEANLETQDDLAIGRLIGFGAYEIVRELGRGGMGAVYLARRVDGTFDRQVAVKVVRSDNSATSPSNASTARAQTPRAYPASGNRHALRRRNNRRRDAVLRHGVCRRPLRYGLLRSQAAHCARPRHSFSGDLRRCRARHVPIIHCDLKPGNILVDADGHPRVLDFGIATALTRGGQEADPPLDPYGSPRYASPEQLHGEPLQTTSDIYSLGVILHELLVGQPPAGRAAPGRR